MRIRLAALATAATLVLTCPPAAASPVSPTSGGWVTTWGTAPAAGLPGTEQGHPNTSIRNVVRASVGGSSARIWLSNAFGTRPVLVGHATLALAVRANNPDAVTGSMRGLTFGGAASVTLPVGGRLASDPVPLNVPDQADLLVTVYTPHPSGPVTYHPDSLQFSFLARGGDHAAQESGTSFSEASNHWQYVDGVDVAGGRATRSVVAFGDSITDGAGSNWNNLRWPDFLARRLLRAGRPMGVVNTGISGNRLLRQAEPAYGPSALSRLDRDVLSRSGVRTVVLLEGINDIHMEPPVTNASEIIGAYRQLVDRAHARGIRVVGGTLIPFKGFWSWTPSAEATRQAVNRQIRAGRVFDAVVDFDAVVRDPADPRRMLPAYDCGDHIHPGDKGYEVMGNAVDLKLL